MRVPISWLRDLVELPREVSAREIADRLISVGLEVETVDTVGAEVNGPLVFGRVVSFEEESHSNGKSIRWCQVDVGEPGGPRGIVCGAGNFAVDDLVVVALPGASLPGGFGITSRKTYGHVSDGMICSTRELGVGDDHDGIWVLPDDAGLPGDDAIAGVGLRDDVLDIAVTPDRGYALSMRGVARECAGAFGVTFTDPVVSPQADDAASWPVDVQDRHGCDRFVARALTGLNPSMPTPLWMQRRLQLAGMRPISLAVDITNYVMVEIGQPLHAYDRDRLSGPIVVRRAKAGETLTTLDGAQRELDVDDLLIVDDSGPIGIAGVMGGASTEIHAASTEVVIESAHFDPASISRSARRHKLPSEASRRFARGVDTALQEAAAERAAELLATLGGARIEPGRTVAGEPLGGHLIEFRPALASELVGVPFEVAAVRDYLERVGCEVRSGSTDAWMVVAPSWRPDLTQPADLVEEVARQHGYQHIPSELPSAPASSGLTASQRARRRVGMTLAGAGYVETQSYPFLSPRTFDDLQMPPADRRRHALALANPLSDEEPLLRTTLLPGVLGTLKRNVGRGATDVALFEMGRVYRPEDEQQGPPPRPVVSRRPNVDELHAVARLLPRQPRRVAVVLSGERERSGWWGVGRGASWVDAVDAGRLVAEACGVTLEVAADEHAPWHPGRCAALTVEGELVGHAGELHPQTIAAMGLPERTCAMEIELDLLLPHDDVPVRAPRLSTFPVAKEDLALIVDDDVPSGAVAEALRRGGGEIVESVRLFDIYGGEQLEAGKRSLAFALRLRAPDRTLTPDEIAQARAGAVAEAERATGASLRA